LIGTTTPEIRTFNVEVAETAKFHELIKLSVNYFNEELIKENSDYRLQHNYKMYQLKKSKKSGKADFDLPSKLILILGYDSSALIADSLNYQFTLIDRNTPDSRDYLILVRGRRQPKSQNFECKKCSIL